MINLDEYCPIENHLIKMTRIKSLIHSQFVIFLINNHYCSTEDKYHLTIYGKLLSQTYCGVCI